MLALCLGGGARVLVETQHTPNRLQRHEVERPGVANCSEQYFENYVDHFNFHLGGLNATYKQRYFVYDEFWSPPGNGPIFFYCGNEADVELYVNATGLMWEHAQEVGALIIFAEHRYERQYRTIAMV